MIRRPKSEPLLRPFKGSGRLRERASDANCFPVEFLTYYDDSGNLRSFAYVRKEDGGDIPDGHYIFLDELGERSFRWRKWKGKLQFGWRYRGICLVMVATNAFWRESSGCLNDPAESLHNPNR